MNYIMISKIKSIITPIFFLFIILFLTSFIPSKISYANSNLQGRTISATSVGILPGPINSKQFNAVLTSLEGKVDSIIFDDGDYVFYDQIFLKSIKLIGSQKTNFIVSDNFNPKAKRIFLTNINRHDIKYQIGFENINFYYITSSNHTLKNEEIGLVTLSDISSCTIKNCNFIAQHSSIDSTFMKCNLLWFENSSNNNITIQDSNFINATASNIPASSTVPFVGGCLWLSGISPESEFENVTVSNCTFSSNCSDEALAIWKCTANNIKFNHCTFLNDCNYTNNLTSLYNGTFNNIEFRDCNYISNGSAECFIKLRHFLSNSTLNFIDCNFTNSCSNQIIKLNSVFYSIDNSTYSFIRKDILIDNCSFMDNSNKQHFKCAININGGNNYNYELRNCDILMPLNKAMINYIYSTNCSVHTHSSLINTSSKLSNVTDSSNIVLDFNNNTIQ